MSPASSTMTSPQSMAPPLSTSTSATSGVEADVAELWARYEQMKYSDVLKTVLLEELLGKYERSQKTLRDLRESKGKELAMIEMAHYYENLSKERARQLCHIQDLLNLDPFVMIVVDGNGTIFHNSFLARGETGGMKAAAKLHRSVIDYVTANVVECPSSVRIACRVYADLNLVAETCVRIGLVDDGEKVREFFRGFTRGSPLFDFVDVGSGRDRVEAKVTEAFQLHLFDYHCRQILLGCGHDSGYARLLKQYDTHDSTPGRVTLMESVPFGKELRDLPFRTTKFSGLFCEAKIPLQHTVGSSLLNRTPMSPTNPLQPSNGARKSTSRQDSGLANLTSWAATAARNAKEPLSDHTRISSAASRSAGMGPPGVKQNRAGQRLDADLHYDRDEVQRIKKLKSCNQHYIGAGCCHYNAGKSDKCPHGHSYNLSEAEKQVLRVIARETPCKRGHGCVDPACIYGHRCPFPVAAEGSLRGSSHCMNGVSCRFPASMHGMDLQPVRTIKIA